MLYVSVYSFRNVVKLQLLVNVTSSNYNDTDGLIHLSQADTEIKKKRTFRKFTYRGVDLDQLLDMS